MSKAGIKVWLSRSYFNNPNKKGFLFGLLMASS